MKSVMYHYVRRFDQDHPNFRFLHIENFKKQLDYFEKKFGFVTPQEWHQFIDDGTMPKQRTKVVLTFDDAMSCHYHYVYPELKKRGIWGIFYVPTLPYETKQILDVHRIHLLCGAFNAEDLLNEAQAHITDEIIPDAKRKEFHEMPYHQQENLAGVYEFKRLLNYFIDYEYRESFIDKLAAAFAYRFHPESFYVSVSDLKHMADNGMVIGSHTKTHPVMSRLSKPLQEQQIQSSFYKLDSLGLINKKTYCHPYGGAHSFNDDTIHILDNEGVAYSFSVEPRDIEVGDYKYAKQCLPRYDCNHFEYGQAS